jgi:hypothetical protein
MLSRHRKLEGFANSSGLVFVDERPRCSAIQNRPARPDARLPLARAAVVRPDQIKLIERLSFAGRQFACRARVVDSLREEDRQIVARASSRII